MIDIDRPIIALPKSTSSTCDDLTTWIYSLFLNEDSPYYKEDHKHLRSAHIGFLWSNVPNKKQNKIVLGTAEIFSPKGDAWQKARQHQQIISWFNRIPDFIITLYAPILMSIDLPSFCAVIDHELYHCGQKRGHFSEPLFDRKTGKPKYCIIGHSFEEFTGVIRSWGLGAVSPEISEAFEYAKQGAEFDLAQLANYCGCK